MRVGLALAALVLSSSLAGTGCRSTVRLEVPPSPAVRLPADAIAVIAYERQCQASADALVQELADGSFLRVDPRAELRIELFNCGGSQEWLLEEQQAPGEQRSRTTVRGRAHAVAAVSYQGRILANLIGAGRSERSSAWGQPSLAGGTRGAVHKHALEDLAADLVNQLSPVPTVVERRVYPNAGSLSAKEFTTLAVEAEARGELDVALILAEEAWKVDPNPRTAGYVAELKRLWFAGPPPGEDLVAR